MKKLMILVLGIALIAIGIFVLESKTAENQIDKEIKKCQSEGDNSQSCIYELAIKNNDSKICKNLGENAEECKYDLQLLKNEDVCKITDEKEVDLCAITFPERFKKIDCDSLSEKSLIAYCKVAKEA